MDILQVFTSFQTQEQAVNHLEKRPVARSPDLPILQGRKNLPPCQRRPVGSALAMSRLHPRLCRDRRDDLSRHAYPASKLVLVLALMLNAKKSASAYQIARDLGMRRPTVWSMMHRVRIAMANDPAKSDCFTGLSRPMKPTLAASRARATIADDDDKPNKRGRGTKKAAVIGVVERGGRVVARVAEAGPALAQRVSQIHRTALSIRPDRF